MCFNNNTPKPPEIRPVQPPPPVKPLQIAQQSTLPSREVKKKERKIVKFGSKSGRNANNRTRKDASSLLIPMNTGDSTSGGLNV